MLHWLLFNILKKIIRLCTGQVTTRTARLWFAQLHGTNSSFVIATLSTSLFGVFSKEVWLNNFFLENVPINPAINKRFVKEHKQTGFHSQKLELKPYFFTNIFSLLKLENWYVNRLILFSLFLSSHPSEFVCSHNLLWFPTFGSDFTTLSVARNRKTVEI